MGAVPVGAVVTDAEGTIVARGRNRIADTSAPDKQVYDDTLAHAEINALLSLNLDQENRHNAALYTTMEPCPLCMGGFYMSSVRTLHFAARDPWAGSVNLLGTTPYLSLKPIRVFTPTNTLLEETLVALQIEWELFDRGERILTSRYFNAYRAILPNAVEKGIALYRSGELRREPSRSADEFFNRLALRVQ